MIARAVGERLTGLLGQQIVVENRVGGGGKVGMESAMKSAPDGYTILITNDNAASAPHVQGLPYDFTKELLPICYLGRHGQVFGAHASLGVKTLQDLIDLAKKDSSINTATSGVGSNQHVLLEWINKVAGVKLQHVPYRGAGQAINDFVGGQVKTAILAPSTQVQHHAAGRIRMLAQSTTKRSPVLDYVPTFDEAGLKGVVLEAWYGAFAPPKTPPEIIVRLNTEMNKALKDPKLVDTFTKVAIEAVGGTPDDLGKLARADSDKYARLVKELGVKIGG
ncbi:MAG TPA: tripartite tricarboxylate transporter substrate binding protein [Xanthobacteraceae bacterium]|nr:tripartite tricarboxylate transporter substrate binding protein [Xanthobacteraceae bacterium]